MKYLYLVWAALFRRKGRTYLTLVSVVVSFLLFGLLDAVRSTFEIFGQTVSGYDRLITSSKLAFGNPLPISLLEQIKQLPGVVGVDFASYLHGTYQSPANAISVGAHPDSFYDLYPELEVAPSARSTLQRTRTGILVSETLSKKFNWKVGDKIPLETTLAQKDGSITWTFDVVGVYRFTDPNFKGYENKLLYSNWDYLNEARASGNGTVAYYAVKVASISGVDGVSRAIDALSENSDHETKTQSENAFSAASIAQMGNIGFIVTSIIGAVLFTLLLLTGHTIAQAVHERIPELAILKTVGFTGRRIMALVLGESCLLLVLGSAIGLSVAAVLIAVTRSLSREVLPIPVLPVSGDTWLRGVALALVIGIIVGAIPAVRGLRLRIVDALSRS